jgi:hypothetical protein
MTKHLFFLAAALLIFPGCDNGKETDWVATPLKSLDLVGHWNCMETGVYSGAGEQDWSPIIGGRWLRTTDTVAGKITGEHLLTFTSAKQYTLINYFWDGSHTVDVGVRTEPNRIEFHPTYPPAARKFSFVRVNPSRYTTEQIVDIRSSHVRVRTVCDRRS